MDSSGHTDVSEVRASASGSNDVFEDDLGLPAKPDALGKNFAHLSRDEGRDLNLESFVVLSKIAEGAFGKVVLARKKRTDSLHAIKAVRKDKILACGSTAIRHILDENKILQQLRHPFILTLQHAFQDEFRLYLVTNYVGGGTLYQLITARGTLAEEVGRFYAAQLVAAFAYLHSYGVVYRDLKPENVLLGLDGYVVLADFGLAKTLRLEDEKRPQKQLAASFRQTFRHSIVKTETFCGTPLYLAPEVVAKTPYGRSVDWWTLGCLTVEMLTGRPPFIARDMPELMEKISKGADLSHLRLSDDARIFCLGLLQRDVDKRLGCGENGSQALRSHAFLATIDWPKLESKRSEPPFKPDAAVQAMGPGSYGRQASKEDLKAFDEFAAYSRVDPRAKAELVGKLCEAATRGDCAELRELIAEGAEVTTGGLDLCRNQISGAPRHRRDVVPATASAR